jgi:hypothetical protein
MILFCFFLSLVFFLRIKSKLWIDSTKCTVLYQCERWCYCCFFFFFFFFVCVCVCVFPSLLLVCCCTTTVVLYCIVLYMYTVGLDWFVVVCFPPLRSCKKKKIFFYLAFWRRATTRATVLKYNSKQEYCTTVACLLSFFHFLLVCLARLIRPFLFLSVMRSMSSAHQCSPIIFAFFFGADFFP